MIGPVKLLIVRKDPSILTGIVRQSDPSTGREIIDYQWLTTSVWLGNLKKASRC